MKPLLPFILLVILFSSCKKDNNTETNIKLSPFIIDNYTEDAKQLYFDGLIKHKESADYMNTELNQSKINKILQVIQAVYNSHSPERDTVFEIYSIHGYYCYSFNSISLKVDTSKEEIQNLAKGIIPTGQADLDQLLNTYQFDSVETFYDYPNFEWIYLKSQGEYNMIPLEKAFSQISSVKIAEFQKGCIGGGNTITLQKRAESDIITFSIGRGDCPAGCLYHRYWEFEVKNGQATFKRSYE